MSAPVLQNLPDPSLAPFVDGYFQVESPPDVVIDQVVVPRGRTAMIFTSRGTYHAALGDAPHEQIADGIVHGQFTRHARNRFSGGIHGFMVMLSPVGWHGLTGADAAALTDAWGEFRDAAPHVADDFETIHDTARTTDDFEERCRVANEVLGRLVERNGGLSRHGELAAAAVSRIDAVAGVIGVKELADELATTERTLRRAFERAVGVGPKMYASILRVHQVIADLHRDPPDDWADVVERYGYADQSHFGREFRRFTGSRPTEYLPEHHPLEKTFSQFE